MGALALHTERLPHRNCRHSSALKNIPHPRHRSAPSALRCPGLRIGEACHPGPHSHKMKTSQHQDETELSMCRAALGRLPPHLRQETRWLPRTDETASRVPPPCNVPSRPPHHGFARRSRPGTTAGGSTQPHLSLMLPPDVQQDQAPPPHLVQQHWSASSDVGHSSHGRSLHHPHAFRNPHLPKRQKMLAGGPVGRSLTVPEPGRTY